jgi:hypothetical protein
MKEGNRLKDGKIKKVKRCIVHKAEVRKGFCLFASASRFFTVARLMYNVVSFA